MSVLAEANLLNLLVALALAILVTTLHLLLASSLNRPYIAYWTVGWAILAVHLGIQLGLRLGYPGLISVQHSLGSLAAYGFGICVLLGCRNYALGRVASVRALTCFVLAGSAMVVLPLCIQGSLSTWLPEQAAQDLSLILSSSSVLTITYLGAVSYLGRADRGQSSIGASGRLVLGLSLLVAGLYEFHEVVLVLAAWWRSDVLLSQFVLNEAPFDLVVGMLVAFGCVMLALDSVREELERVNAELATASQRLERLAHHDAMTEVLNRHAFYTLFEPSDRTAKANARGSVVILDVDHLKPINDQWGHAAGDAAIRLAAKAIRSLIRADDLLFRWGGDEFLVLLPNVSASDASARLTRLDDILRGSVLPGVTGPIDLSVSFGATDYQGLKEVEGAIATADRLMFQTKAARRHSTSKS